MADCAEVKSELAALRAEIAKLGKVDEESIIQKAFNRAKNHLEPIISGVSVVALGATVKATSAYSLGEIASIKAGAAFNQAAAAGNVAQVAKTKSLAAEFAAASAGAKATQATGLARIAQGAATAAGSVAAAASAFAATALGKALLALANLATIAGSIAGLFALYATLQVVFPRLDAHDRELDSLRYQIGKVEGEIYSVKQAVGRAQATADQANAVGERALDEAYNANRKIELLTPKVEDVTSRVSVVEPKVADNTTKIRLLAPKVEDVTSRVSVVEPKVADNTTKIRLLAPKVEDVTSRVSVIEPKVADNTTKIRLLAPKVEGVTSRVSVVEPKVADNTTKIRLLAPKVDEAIRVANEALKAKSIPGKDGAPGKNGVGIPGVPGKDGVGIPGKDGIGIPGVPGKNGVGTPGKDGRPGKDAPDDPALKIRVSNLEVKVKEQEIVNQKGLTLIQQLPTVIEPTIVNAVTKTVNAIVPISIEQAKADVKKTFDDISQANRKALEPQFQKTIDANKVETAKLNNTVTKGFKEVEKKVEIALPSIGLPGGVKQPNNQDLQDQIRLGVGGLTVLLAGVTAALKPISTISNNTTPASIQNNTAAGVCRTTQPGGCMSNLANNVGNNAVNNVRNNIGNILGGANALANARQLALLRNIQSGVNAANTKLGPLMRGANGISGFLGRLSSSLGIDRALNLIAIASNLHNAMMLSANLKITLLEVLSSVGNATGLLQTSENENIDLNQVFNQGIEAFMTTLIGVDNYAGLKVNFRKYNSIYRAATNSLNAISSMFNSIGDAIETTAEHTGKIGNALRAASVVRENAYNFMTERVSVRNSRFMTFENKIGGVTQVLETINEIAENVVEGQEQYTEAVKATNEFKTQLANADRPQSVDNKLIKEEAEKIKANLIKDPTGEDETGLLSFLTD